jgi:hypothetical protein
MIHHLAQVSVQGPWTKRSWDEVCFATSDRGQRGSPLCGINAQGWWLLRLQDPRGRGRDDRPAACTADRDREELRADLRVTPDRPRTRTRVLRQDRAHGRRVRHRTNPQRVRGPQQSCPSRRCGRLPPSSAASTSRHAAVTASGPSREPTSSAATKWRSPTGMSGRLRSRRNCGLLGTSVQRR